MTKRRLYGLFCLAGLFVVGAAVLGMWWLSARPNLPPIAQKDAAAVQANPLHNRTFYADDQRPVALAAQQYRQRGDQTGARFLSQIAAQPGTTWLTGPTASDTQADHDINEVDRTSAAAAKQGTTPVYELYALPGRDACGGLSQSGFTSDEQYEAWIGRILAALHTPAVFSVEADGLAQTVGKSCLSPNQIQDRKNLLRTTIGKLHASPKALAVYLDAGNPEWFPNPANLVAPLRQAGVDQANGVAVNVSYFVGTADIARWSQQLLKDLGGNKGVIVDTSRNGRGAPPPNITGQARWCNPAGRALGPRPTTNVSAAHIDAYFWGKNIGESDGNCFGSPPAGTFVAQTAIDLARSADK